MNKIYVLYHIPSNPLEDEKSLMGIFTTKKSLFNAFSEYNEKNVYEENRLGIKSDGFILYDADKEENKNREWNDDYIFERILVGKIIW